MKLAEAMICWTPKYSDRPSAGECMVGRYLSGSWHAKYAVSDGACFSYLKKLSAEQKKTWLLATFVSMVIRDGVAPEKVHEQFLKIDEYRKAICPDVPGADPD